MLKLSDYSNHMMKTSFDVPNPPIKKSKKYIVYQDHLFFALYSKINHIDKSVCNMSDYNETNEKIKIAECLENLKFKNKEEIINNLVYDKVITLPTFYILVTMFYKLNLIYIKERTYVDMKCDSEQPIVYIDYKGVFLETEPDLNSLLPIKLEKPLRPISFYKLGDLQTMSTQLAMDSEKKKKQELYDSIKTVLSSLYKIE